MKTYIRNIVLLTVCLLGSMAVANAQEQETYTGAILSYGSRNYIGTRTSNFTLKVDRLTPNDKAQQFLTSLQTDGQNGLMSRISKEELGTFRLDGDLARTLNAVWTTNSNGKRTIRAVFERWQQFAEIRGQRRSLDYPFGYIELTIDPSTGKGSGKYFAAAKIRWKTDKKTGASYVEVEDYGTIPAKLLNVRMSKTDM